MKNKKVFTWTINDPLQMRTCVLWQVDGVIGDSVPNLLKYVQEQPKSLNNPEEYQSFVDSDTYLQSKRTRIYLYLLKKAMFIASWKFIGL